MRTIGRPGKNICTLSSHRKRALCVSTGHIGLGLSQCLSVCSSVRYAVHTVKNG